MNLVLKFFVLTSTLLLPLSVFAKPLPLPKFEEGIKQSTVAVCEFVSFKSDDKIDYFGGVRTKFRVLAVLSRNKKLKERPKSGQQISVNYQFDDGSACLAPKPWKFDKSMVPKKNDLKILFLNDIRTEVYSTYRGSYGVKKYTKALELKISRISKGSI